MGGLHSFIADIYIAPLKVGHSSFLSYKLVNSQV